MKLYILWIVVILCTCSSGGRRKNPDGKTPCQVAVERAESEGKQPPTCNEMGRYVKKQCDDKGCWCVSRYRGRKIYNQQRVPKDHPFNCKFKPGACYVQEMEAMLSGEAAPWMAKCDCDGWYEEKQCQLNTTCITKRRLKRSAEEECKTEHAIGSEIKTRPLVDRAREWTMVSKTGFSTHGIVTNVYVYVGATGRPLRVAIYRPTGNNPCHFTLMQQVEVDSLSLGSTEFPLSESERFRVSAGDRYGFSWLEYGVIEYTRVVVNRPLVVDPYNYCEDKSLFNVGDTAFLEDRRHGNREYSILFQFLECPNPYLPRPECIAEGESTFFGFEPLIRERLDQAQQWTMVSMESFPTDGEVTSFSMYVAGEGRPMRLGIYRPTATGQTCQFKLIQQRQWPGFKEGFTKVELVGDEVFRVKAGDHYGFTWLNFGVIPHVRVDIGTKNYCEKDEAYNVQQVATMDDTHSNRIYSLRLEFTPCRPNPGIWICGGGPSVLGFEPINRKKVDSSPLWTMVSKAAFLAAGEVRAFEVHVVIGHPLRVGIYRPASEEDPCHFTLVQQVEWNGLTTGYQRVELSGSEVLKVQPGDHYGFSWVHFGVLDYSDDDNDNYCEDMQAFTEGDDVMLTENRFGNRQYSLRMELTDCHYGEAEGPRCTGDEQSTGFEPIKRAYLNDGVWTAVSKQPFSVAGEVTSFEMYVEGPSKPFRLGVYRPTLNTCQYMLLEQKEWSGFPAGYVRMQLNEHDYMRVEAGDYYGFTFTEDGVVPFGAKENNDMGYYCEKAEAYSVGDLVTLDDLKAHKFYSFRITMMQCGPDIGPSPKSCQECFCVDKYTGEEIADTRSSGQLICD